LRLLRFFADWTKCETEWNWATLRVECVYGWKVKNIAMIHELCEKIKLQLDCEREWTVLEVDDVIDKMYEENEWFVYENEKHMIFPMHENERIFLKKMRKFESFSLIGYARCSLEIFTHLSSYIFMNIKIPMREKRLFCCCCCLKIVNRKKIFFD